MERCACMQELISRMLDEDLNADEQAALAEHLESCGECRAMYEAFAAVSAALGGELEEPPESLSENVMAEIRRGEIRKRNRRLWRASLSVVAVLVLALGLRLGFGPRLSGLPVSAAVTEKAVSFEAASGLEEAAEESADESPAEESADESPAEESAVFRAAGDAPRIYAANSAADAAAPEAAQKAAESADAAAVGPAWEIDLSFLTYAELLEKLRGKPVDIPLDRLAEPENVTVICADNMLALFAYEGDWYYYVASDPTPRRSRLGPEELLALAGG